MDRVGLGLGLGKVREGVGCGVREGVRGWLRGGVRGWLRGGVGWG